jgi:hypothetical protein
VLRGERLDPAAIDREFAERAAILQKQAGQNRNR